MTSGDPFSMLGEVAAALDPQSWVVVGGLMVHGHSVLAGVSNPRPTDDADLVLEVSVISYAEAAASLCGIGFEPYTSLDHREPFYRFQRGDQQIDLMVPDRSTGVRFQRRDILAVPGAHSAIKRTELFRLSSGVMIRIPDLPSALSLKGAASQTPSGDPLRHLRDGVVLLACAEGRKDLRLPSKSMRANINRLLLGLRRPEAWTQISAEVAAKAVRTIRQQYRPDWQQPVPVLPERFRLRPKRP